MPWFVVWDENYADGCEPPEDALGVEAANVEEAAELYMDKEHDGWGPPVDWPHEVFVMSDADTPRERIHVVAITVDWDPVFTGARRPVYDHPRQLPLLIRLTRAAQDSLVIDGSERRLVPMPWWWCRATRDGDSVASGGAASLSDAVRNMRLAIRGEPLP